MKTAVSIPDSVFNEAKQLAKRLGISRSKLFACALEAYIEAHKEDRVREALDEIYALEASSLDHSLLQMQLLSLPKEDW